MDYYSGMDSYIFRGDLNTTWQVNPMNDVKSCFETPGTPDILPYMPNLAGFTVTGDAVQINDQECDNWKLAVTTLNKTSNYDFYVSRTTGLPVRYQMMGYDSLIGSHFDLYILDYTQFVSGVSWNSSVFDQPPLQCGGFPGPGATHMNPLEETSPYFPGGASDGIVSAAYASYLETHGKSYESLAELRTREMQFTKHSHFILSHQRRYRIGRETYTVALNFLADHTTAELASRRGRLATPKEGRKANNAGGYHQRNYYDKDLPSSVDWRPLGAVSAPQDQGICGSSVNMRTHANRNEFVASPCDGLLPAVCFSASAADCSPVGPCVCLSLSLLVAGLSAPLAPSRELTSSSTAS